MTTQGLKFAPVVRVSSESQEAKGDSINYQKQQIKDAVGMLQGTIPESCWNYTGQEHSTPQSEREKLNQLLKDSATGLFDAVICTNVTRWSRDNLKSKQGLEILRNNSIRFFVGSMEIDLYDPSHVYMVSSQVETGEFTAMLNARNSVNSRIIKAKQGYWTRGHPPTARKKDETGKLVIIPEYKRRIEQGANLFLNGHSLMETCRIIGMDVAQLRKTFLYDSGDTMIQKFESKRFNISEEITTKVPRLLEDNVIDAIKKRLEHNKTIYHGNKGKNKYLLSSMILCGHCNEPLSGVTYSGKQYYKRFKKACHTFVSIRADLIEEAVMLQLFATLGDLPKIKEAMKNAQPDIAERTQLENDLENNNQELMKIKKAKNNWLKMIDTADDIKDILFDELKEKLPKFREREAAIKLNNVDIQSRLSKIPSSEAISMKSKLIQRTMEDVFQSPEHLQEMSFDDKRKMLQMMFEGRDSDGKRHGVYLYKDDTNKKQPWYFEIRGNFVTDTGRLPMSLWEKQGIMGYHGDCPDDYDPLKPAELNCSST